MYRLVTRVKPLLYFIETSLHLTAATKAGICSQDFSVSVENNLLRANAIIYSFLTQYVLKTTDVSIGKRVQG